MESQNKKITAIGLIIWFTCAFFYALEYFIRSSTGALLEDFMASPYSLQSLSVALLSSSFYWAYVIAQIPAGILVDKYGIKKVMIASTTIFSIAMFIAAVATSHTGLILYRIFAGLGGGFAFLCSLKAISIWLPNRLFPMFTGLTQLLLYTGATVSAAPLVYIANHASIAGIMSCVFVISLIVLLISIFVIKLHPDYSDAAKNKEDTRSGFKNLKNILTNKQVWLNGFYCFTIYGTTVIFADLWGIRYLELAGYREESAGLCVSLIFIGVAVFSPIWGIVATIFNGERRFLLTAPIFGIIIVTYLIFFTPSLLISCALCVLFGGVQAVHVLNYSALRNTVPVAQIATGLAIVNIFLPLSGGILQPITGVIIGTMKQYYDPLYSFKVALLFVPVLMLLSFIIAIFIKDKKK